MKIFLISTVVLVTLISQISLAETREITTMSEILPAIDAKTLVVFDLDNTVMDPAQTLGSDQWYKSLVKNEASDGVDQYTAIDDIVPRFISVQEVTRVMPTEAETPAIIRMLQEKGVPVMALTARPVQLVQRTLAELASIGVDFTLQPVYPRNTLIGNSPSAAYVRGVALIGPHGDKGSALVTFLRQIGQIHYNIVFVDDTPQNVVSVEKALASYPYGHVSFRYGYDDRKVSQFNPAVANLEWNEFEASHTLLSDEGALQILGESKVR